MSWSEADIRPCPLVSPCHSHIPYHSAVPSLTCLQLLIKPPVNTLLITCSLFNWTPHTHTLSDHCHSSPGLLWTFSWTCFTVLLGCAFGLLDFCIFGELCLFSFAWLFLFGIFGCSVILLSWKLEVFFVCYSALNLNKHLHFDLYSVWLCILGFYHSGFPWYRDRMI